jgi:hypothetical protein
MFSRTAQCFMRISICSTRSALRRLVLLLTKTFALACFTVIFCPFGFDSLRGQNIVERTTTQFTANPVRLTDTEVSEFLFRAADFKVAAASAEAGRVATKLEAHVSQFIDGAPWLPFHHTLGISGYEIYFNHPDEVFYALSIALPCLPNPTATRLKEHLRAQLAISPPYAEAGFDHRTGRPRESYDVPDNLRVHGVGNADSAFGVYAFWAYCHGTADTTAAREHWTRIKARTKTLLGADYKFDPAKRDSTKGEAEKLNGDLAGLIGLIRLARLNNDGTIETQARGRARELLELRVNLERINPHLLEKSNLASKDLHNARLSRYCDLVPEVGVALAKFSAGCGARNLKAFREERNGWYLAFGDRFIGGENYTNPLHFPRSLFAGAAFIEQLPGTRLLTFIDVPWCPGDFYFIEKCVLALWAEAGWPWHDL